MTANHPSHSREVRAGALAALKALQQVESMAKAYEASDTADTPKEALHADADHRQRVVDAVLAAAGELSPHAEGFIASLAEYVDFGFRIGEADLATWGPEAAMSARDSKKIRAEALADMQAVSKPKSKRTIDEVMDAADVPDFARDFVASVLECKRAQDRRQGEGVTIKTLAA